MAYSTKEDETIFILSPIFKFKLKANSPPIITFPLSKSFKSPFVISLFKKIGFYLFFNAFTIIPFTLLFVKIIPSPLKDSVIFISVFFSKCF